VLFRNDVDPARGERIADFLAHEQKIVDLAAHMEEARLEMQEEWGFRSRDGVTLESLRSSVKVVPGPKHAMEIGGDDWELVEVHEKFTYHPELSMSAATSKTADPILKDENGDRMPMDNRLLATFLVNGNEYEIRATDTFVGRRELKALSEALFYHTLSVEMGELAETLEAGAMFMIDVIELIPGLGQAAMVGRLTASMLVFAAEIPELAAALRKDPIEYVKTLAARLVSDYLRLETIILFFLLGEGQEPLADQRRPKPPPPKVKPKGKLARAIAILRRLGMRLADALRWLRLRVAGPVRALQSSIATRPKLGWLLQRAVDIALWLSHVVPSEDPAAGVSRQERLMTVLAELVPIGAEPPETAPAEQRETHARGVLAGIEAEVKQAAEHFKQQLDEVLGHLQEAELPDEIVPLQLVMEWMIDFFLSRLGAKVRIARRLLEHTDVYKELRAAVGSALAVEAKGSALDPNVHWRSLLLDPLDDRFREARNGLIAGIYRRTDDIAGATGIDFFRLPRPAEKARGEFGVQRAAYPMAELNALHGAVPARGRLAELPATPGQPLAAAVRVVEERRFGHDLGHVRLHAGAETAPALDGVGANALTSGSHVFLRPGLDPGSGLGARVLRHELTHVLQQTGPRPRGRAHETRPVRGRPGAGLTVDRLREAAAETMANADRAAVAREPVDVNAGAEGVQPNLDGAVTSVLATLTTFQSAAAFDKPTGGKAVPGESDAKAAWKLVREHVAAGRFDVLPFARSVVKPLLAHMAATVHDTDIPGVAALAQKPAKGARGQKPKNTQLDFERFVTLLEGFVLAKSGVAMQIKISGPPSPSLKRVEVTYVHFGVISPTTATGSALWDAVMKATPGLSADDQTKLRAELYARLAALGPDPFVWKTARPAFRFSEEFVEAFGKVRVRGRRPELESDLPVVGQRPQADPAVVPPAKDEYLNPSGQKGIGLRVGVHHGQKGTDRESHHTTQYLLVQYFRNNNSVKAWRANVSYPGISPTTGKDRRVFTAVGRPALGLKALDEVESSRGAGMPAILVSADLHRRGRLHIERESRWTGRDEDPDGDAGQGPTRQGFAIDRIFKAALQARFGARDDSPGWANAVKAKAKPDGLIHEAMIDTYRWMRAIMLPALERGLVTRELAYYRGIAARRHLERGATDTPSLPSAYNLSADDMRAVHKRAVANNDKVMGDQGWKL
jgi:hypothetical protein